MEACEHGYSLLCGELGHGHAMHYDPAQDQRACGEAEGAVKVLETLLALEQDPNLPRAEYEKAHAHALAKAQEMVGRYRGEEPEPPPADAEAGVADPGGN